MKSSDSNTRIVPFAPLPVSHQSLPAWLKRIILIIHGKDIDPSLAFRILEIAKPLELNVLLLGICNDQLDEPELRRHLVTIAAFLHDAQVDTEIRIEYKKDWIETMKTLCQTNDMLACYDGDTSEKAHSPLSQIMASTFETPIYDFTEIDKRQPASGNITSKIFSWFGSLSIIAGSLFLQIKATQVTESWASTILLMISVVAEFGLIWLWNSLVG